MVVVVAMKGCGLRNLLRGGTTHRHSGGHQTPDTLVSMVVVAVVMAVIVFYQGLWSQESAACDTLDNTRYTSQYGGCVVVGGVCYKEGLVSGTCSAGVAYWHSGRP